VFRSLPKIIISATLLIVPFDAFSATSTEAFCGENKKGDLPALVFVGEHHLNETSIGVRKLILKGGAEGRYPVASELGPDLMPVFSNRGVEMFPLPFTGPQKPKVDQFLMGADTSKLHGIEGEIPSALTGSYANVRSVIDLNILKKKMPSTLISNLAVSIQLDSLQMSALEILTHHSETAALAKEINSLVERGPESDLSASILDRFGEQKISNFVFKLHEKTIQIANMKYSEQLDGRHLPVVRNSQDMGSFYFCTGWFGCHTSAYDFLSLQIRDRDMAKNLAQVMCLYRGKEKHLFVLVGDDHVPGILFQLSDIFSDNYTARIYRSYNEDQTALLKFEHSLRGH
jgi:hypothetical protein